MFIRENVLNSVPTLYQNVTLLPEGENNLKVSKGCKKYKEVGVWWKRWRQGSCSVCREVCLSPLLYPH